MKLYGINHWNEIYENNRSRSVEDLKWVLIPIKHDGEHYTRIITSPNGAVIFSAFILMVEVAAKCRPRGWLIKDNREPHTPMSLSMKTRAPIDWFEQSIEYVMKHTDWLLAEDFSPKLLETVSQVTVGCQPGVLEGNRIEGNGTEWKGRERAVMQPIPLPPEAEYWNRYAGNLPKVLTFNNKRLQQLYARRKDPFWVENLEQAIIKLSTNPFCNGDNDRGWLATFDWLIERTDAVAKVMEGKYDGQRHPFSRTNPRNHGVTKSGPGYGQLAKEKLRRQDGKP